MLSKLFYSLFVLFITSNFAIANTVPTIGIITDKVVKPNSCEMTIALDINDTDGDFIDVNASLIDNSLANIGVNYQALFEELDLEMELTGIAYNLGESVSLSDDGKIVAILGEINSLSSAVQIFAWNGTSWVKRGTVLRISGGTEVVLSGDASTVAIGGKFRKAVEIYKWVAGDWHQAGATLLGEVDDSQFASNISLSNDGNTIAIGAQRIREHATARIFHWTGITWGQKGNELFGLDVVDQNTMVSVSLSNNGDVVAIGVHLKDEKTTNVSIFKWNGFLWLLVGQSISNEYIDERQYYDWSVFLNSTGETVATSESFYIRDSSLHYRGKVRIYQWDTSSWLQKGLDIDGESSNSTTKRPISLSSNGKVIAIGSSDSDTEKGNDSGRVQVYRWDSSTWKQLGIDIDGKNSSDTFGTSLALSADGKTVAVGAPGSGLGTIAIYQLEEEYFLTVTPKANVVGTTQIRVNANDGNSTVQRTFNYTVKNNAPMIATIANQSVEANSSTIMIPLSIEDLDNDIFTHMASVDNTDLVSLSWETTKDYSLVGLDIRGSSGDQAGQSVSVSSDGNTIAVGAIRGNGDFSGNVGIYQWDGSTWVQQGSNIDGEAGGDQSGWGVSLNGDGTLVAIGAPYNDGNGSNSGHVRIFKWNDSIWTQQGHDIKGENENDFFGASVSLSKDSTTVAIGSTKSNENGTSSGHVKVYKWNGFAWIQLGNNLVGQAAGDNFGSSISLSHDGRVIAVGAISSNDGNSSNSGHVRVYKWDNVSWKQVGANINGEAEDDMSGTSVSLSGDGTIVAIGATGNDANGSSSGHVRIYKYCNSSWTQIGADINGEEVNDFFGKSVSLSDDGKTVAIGAYLNDKTGKNSGHVKIFKWDGTSWILKSNPILGELAGDESGWSIALSADGDRVAIGSPKNDSSGTSSGHVRVYDYNETYSISLSPKQDTVGSTQVTVNATDAFDTTQTTFYYTVLVANPNDDDDNDGLTNQEEANLGINPNNSDSDGDGMNDGFENTYGLNPLFNDANEDADTDGYTNLEEYQAGTNPEVDTDFPISNNINPSLIMYMLN